MIRLLRFCVSFLGALVLAAALYLATAYAYSRYLAQYQHRLVAWPPQSEFEEPVAIRTEDPKRVRILSIEGGALYGLADLEVLKAIEEKSGQPIHRLFDFVAGSSTGAIIATLLLNPDPKTGRPLSVDEAIAAYEEFSGKVLDSPLHHTVLTGFGVFGPLMTNRGRIESTSRFVGDARFNDLLLPAMFPAYSQETEGLKVFRNWDRTEGNLYLRALVPAVTSAPAVFPGIALLGDDGEQFYGDPALFSNVPADLAYLHARTHLPDVEEFVVVSLGTTRDFSLPERLLVRGGLADWFTPIFRLLYRGETNVSLGALERHAQFDSAIDVSLTVLSPVLGRDLSGFDPLPENIAAIRRAGQDYVSENEKPIDNVVKQLTGQ